ncbi:MAG: FAD-binding oxidoreductase [Acidobacteria bacterium]|nr:FAD-binding oxidoreductase [Acidobacteriota bacterium]
MTTDSRKRSTYSRRWFLQTSAGLAVGVGLYRPDWLPGYTGLADVRQEVPWTELASALHGQLVRPGDMDYLRYASPWNLRYAGVLPGGIARCADTGDVQASLGWARKYDVPLVIRSGGHSYAGFSTTQGLMIDVSPMNRVSFDPSTGMATLGGGARNADVYANLRPPSVAVTHGRCKAVGVAGLVLGGGIGFNMRAHGLTCDQLVQTEMVLADGSRVICSSSENDELLWASRGGGGGNFGINTSFTIQTFPVGRLTVYLITWKEKIDEVLAALQNVVLASPNEMGCKVSVNAVRAGAENTLNVQLLGQLIGTPSDLRDLLAPVYAISHPGNANEMVMEANYWDGQEFLSEDGTPEYSHERSRYVTGRIPDEGLANIVRHLRDWPGTKVGATWKFFLLGGAISRLRPADTAYVHRDASMISSIEVDWDATEEGTDVVIGNEMWLNEFHASMRPYTSEHSYQNFIDASQTDWQRAYYGTNLERLIEIKTKYDRTNVFHFPQSIPVAPTAPGQSGPQRSFH